MGAKESRISFLTYEDALRRVSNEELNQIRKAFQGYAGTGTHISKTTFFNEVLGNIVPVRLSEQLFMTCGGSSKGISFREVFVILVLITKGSADEKIRFLFYLISVDELTVSKEDLENFFVACDGGRVLPKCISSEFELNGNGKMNFDDFFQWISIHSEFSAVTRWLLEEQSGNTGIQILCHSNTPSFHHSLAEITKLSNADIIELEKRYDFLKSFSKSGRFDFVTFKQHICPPLPERFSESFFHFFDENKDDHLDLKELITGVSICCRGLTKQRLYACFQMFDTDKNDVLSEAERLSMVNGLIEIYEQYEDYEISEADKENTLNDLRKLTRGNDLHFDEFRPWASTNALIHEFLLLLSQICHIIFGLKPSSQEEEGLVIRRWLEREKKWGKSVGRLYYLVSMSWWQKWRNYVHFDKTGLKVTSNGSVYNQNGLRYSGRKIAPNEVNMNHASELPGPIDNSNLLGPQDSRKLMVLTGEGGKLKTNTILIEGKDYEVLPEPIWHALMAWYGGNVVLPRTVIKQTDDSEASLELYPVQLFIYKHVVSSKSTGFNLSSIGVNNFIAQLFGSGSTNGQQQQIQNQHPEQSLITPPKKLLSYRASFSKRNTIKEIIVFIGQKLKINPDDLRLWTMSANEHDVTLIEEDFKTVEELSLKDGGFLLLEVRNRDLSWPEEMNTLVATHNFRERSNTGLLEKGATGLHNLGNTCFMNSAVQCLSNTKPLTQYFCSKVFTYELNKVNPLGMKGILAKRYGDLVLDLWSGIYRSIAPVKLRWTIGRYAPRFNGFQQHDSQELLSFLLDGLHEDVNRVHEKPYVELKDSDGRPDDEVAQEAWENHIKRNQSIIVDLFQGQLKSQVRCLKCNHVSVRFDPFIFLSLPMPLESLFHIEIPVFFCCGRRAHRYGLVLAHTSTINTVKRKLSELCNITVECLLLAEIAGGIIQNFLSDNQKVKTNMIGYTYAYEVDSSMNVSFDFNSPKNKHYNNHGSLPVVRVDKKNTVYTDIKGTTSPTMNGIDNPNSSPFKHKPKSKNISNTLKTKVNIFSHNKTHPAKLLEVCPKNNVTIEVQGVVDVEAESNSNIDMSTIECENSFSGLIVIMNRRMNESSSYFLSWQKYRPMLFGIPIIMSCTSSTTNQDIYEYVWKHVSKLLTHHDKDYPFTLKTVDNEGSYCVWCPWYRFCRGCSLACNNEPYEYASAYLAIDWDPIVLHLHYQYSLIKNYVEDESIEKSYQCLREPICLDKCLSDFTKEEELGADETWYCSKCKDHQMIAKKFDIWKLPPILIIHLKRFQFLNNQWVKSNKLVHFPMSGFDPSTYLVKKRKPPEDKNNGSCEISESEILQSEAMLENDDNRLYDLYAVSCHSGMLNGGHYITYARNPNGKWYCYNDSSCKEIDPASLNKESPYILFYERRHINTIDLLPDIKGRQPLNVTQEEDEFDKEVKKYCVIM